MNGVTNGQWQNTGEGMKLFIGASVTGDELFFHTTATHQTPFVVVMLEP